VRSGLSSQVGAPNRFKGGQNLAPAKSQLGSQFGGGLQAKQN